MNDPKCLSGAHCVETVNCTPESCPYERKGWKHTANCITHDCVHDWNSGPGVELELMYTATCKCGMTAFGHSMRFGP